MMPSAAKRLFTVPEGVDAQDYPEYFGILVAALSGLVVNFILFVAFAYINMFFLMSLSVSGALFWSMAIYFVRKKRFVAAVNIGVFEMMFHVGIMVWIVGTVYGAQLILWPAVVYAAFSINKNKLQTKLMGYLCLIELAALYALVPEQTNVRPFENYASLIFLISTVCSAIPLMIVLLSIKSVQIRQRKQLQYRANYDNLTKLFNRGFFDTLLEYDNKTLADGGGPFCVCLADIDHFKSINDEHGHKIGDQVLVEIATILNRNLRKSDAVCRWGGEEFAIILRRCELSSALPVIEKLKNLIASTTFSSERLTVTLSYGLIQANEAETSDGLIKRADVLLYKAKRRGRDCIVLEDDS
ncbi:GGDEF domain-containing protein [Glaciecola siphonariae]|uniref:diguanylate cyclase n=1 Tax=Glaciecola siphonariae TaxID=521012 RepID=A0ABV9LZI4_9ALTE